jgi:hypothetical protein
VIHAGMEAFIPFSYSSSASSSHWFGGACSDSIKNRNAAYRQWLADPSPITHSNFILARNRAHSILRNTKHNFIHNKCKNASENPSSRSFWSLIKQITKNFTPSSFPPLFSTDGSVVSSPEDKAALFVDRFSTNSNVSDFGISPPTILPLSEPSLKPIFFSYRDVHCALLKLNVRKAYGPDGIPPVVLRECSGALATVLTKLFRLILKTKIFPSSWKQAVVQPVLKKGDPSDPSNYRPIALTSSISKIFETLLNSKLIKHLEGQRLLSDHQYGFRQARSCGDLLAYLTHVWATSLGDFGESVAVALDISKAFDRVWHRALLAKLPLFGISPNIVNLLSSFLSDRSISVRVDGRSSPYCNINSGVPQGSVLSPTLFLLFINDLLSCSSNSIHSYADDSTLHSSSSFISPPNKNSLIASRNNMVQSLSSDLRSIGVWGALNLVNFNTSKTQLSVISLKHSNFEPRVTFDNDPLTTCNSLNILGLNFNSDLSWREYILELAKRASQKLNVLFRFRKFFSPYQLKTLYVSSIRPCMEYCCHIWGGSSSCHILDRFQSKAFRLISSPLIDPIPSLSHRRDVASLSLFYRYYFGHCSLELSNCIPPPLHRPRLTRQAVDSHQYAVALSQNRIQRYAHSFFPRVSSMWNALPATVFPEDYNLQKFKIAVTNHLLAFS